jgi:hypothetical protein
MMLQEAASSPLSAWESFYVIVGSSGAALTGLQFVVIALVADVRPRGSADTIDAFGTPTVVHFSAVLLVAATLSAPWHTMLGPDLILGATGIAGSVYGALVARRARRQTVYRPVLEDWLWHVWLPAVAYFVIFVAAIALRAHATGALFMVGASALLLLFVGIHNAWDTVTYITTQTLRDPDKPRDQSPAHAPTSLTGSLPTRSSSEAGTS